MTIKKVVLSYAYHTQSALYTSSSESLDKFNSGKPLSEPVRSRLHALLALAQVEACHGRWCADKAESEPISVDKLLLQPLCRNWNLKPRTVLRLVSFICSTSDHLLLNCDLVDAPNEPTHIRLELLNPSRVNVDLFDPLSHIGVRQPQKLLAVCPGLLLSSAILSRTPEDQWNGPIPKQRATILLEVLDELGSFLDRKDLLALLNRFPAVLLRPKHELSAIHNYLTESMKLQSSDLARATQTRVYRHMLRNATGLRLVSCPAWCLPLTRIRARHLLAVFAGCWPPSQLSKNGITGNQRLAKLLTVPPYQVPHWLGLFQPDQSLSRDDSTPLQPVVPAESTILLTKADVEAFEHLISQITDESHDGEQIAEQPSVQSWPSEFEPDEVESTSTTDSAK